MTQIIINVNDGQITIVEPAVRLLLWARSLPGQSIKLIGENMTQITDIQSVSYTVTAVDAKGNPTALPGAVTWSVSDPSILTVTPSADGSTAVVAAVGPEGQSQVNASTTDASGKQITGQDIVQVVGSAAATLVLKAGTPS